jgi:predicted dehydrogenase
VYEEAARSTAERWDIPFWTTDIRALLDRDDVRVIDMALHPAARKETLQAIAHAPRPVLTQKPLHMEYGLAEELITIAEDAGIQLAVNQQARWSPDHRALRVLMDSGVAGQIYGIQHLKRSFQDQPGMWWTSLANFNIGDHGVHYLDLCRFFAGSPMAGTREWTRLHCSTAMLPDQNGPDPLTYSANIEFGEVGGRVELMASMQFNNIVRASGAHSYTWWIDGTEGSIWGTSREISIARTDEPGNVKTFSIEGNWFPDAFQGPLGDLIAATAHGREPAVTPRDNLNTIAMTSAAILSSKGGRVVEREEAIA